MRKDYNISSTDVLPSVDARKAMRHPSDTSCEIKNGGGGSTNFNLANSEQNNSTQNSELLPKLTHHPSSSNNYPSHNNCSKTKQNLSSSCDSSPSVDARGTTLRKA